ARRCNRVPGQTGPRFWDLRRRRAPPDARVPIGWRRGRALRQGLRRVLGGVAIVALIAGAAACNKSTSSGSAGGKNCGYKIAFFGALTGSAANLGVNIEQGAELAIDQYNTKNGANCISIA